MPQGIMPQGPDQELASGVGPVGSNAPPQGVPMPGDASPGMGVDEAAPMPNAAEQMPAPGAVPGILDTVKENIAKLQPDQKQLILRYMTPEMVQIMGMMFGQELGEALSSYEQKDKTLEVVDKDVIEHLGREKVDKQWMSAREKMAQHKQMMQQSSGKKPQGVMQPPQAPPSSGQGLSPTGQAAVQPASIMRPQISTTGNMNKQTMIH